MFFKYIFMCIFSEMISVWSRWSLLERRDIRQGEALFTLWAKNKKKKKKKKKQNRSKKKKERKKERKK